MKHILIIEDDIHIADLQKDYLQINGYEVTVANNGKDGLELALNNTYNLFVIDLMLPIVDGYEIIRQIRSKMEVPVIIVSARDDDIDKIRGLGLGANDYMTKPFSPAELIARIKSHITRYEKLLGINDLTSSYSYKGLEIDNKSHKVMVNNQVVRLTNKEYDLLWFLAMHPNIVYTKEALFDEIWGQENFGETSTVPVHIQRIRKKIEKDSSNPEYIETLWGTGYRFNG